MPVSCTRAAKRFAPDTLGLLLLTLNMLRLIWDCYINTENTEEGEGPRALPGRRPKGPTRAKAQGPYQGEGPRTLPGRRPKDPTRANAIRPYAAIKL